MEKGEVIAGFRVYRDYSRRRSYQNDKVRVSRNQYVVESLFGNDERAFRRSKTRKLLKKLYTLQQISDNFFKRVKLEPEVLEAFKNVLGTSFEYGTIDHQSFLESEKSNHFLLLKLLFETLSNNYDKILELENQVHALTDENNNLGTYLSDVQEEMERLRKFASDCNEMRVSEVGLQSEEYQMLYERHSNLQEELNKTIQKNYQLQKKLGRILGKGELREGFEEEFQFPEENMNLFEPILEEGVESEGKYKDYERKLRELKLSNERLFEEKIKLTKEVKESFGADKFVTLSLLFHQITKSFNKLFEDQKEEVKRDSSEHKLTLTLKEARLKTLDYENKTYKEKLNEVEELLKSQTVDRFALESIVSQLKEELYQSHQVYIKLENLNTSLLRSENEVNLLRTNREVYMEQLGRMQHMVKNLTKEKNELVNKLGKMEFTKDSLMREREVLKEQLSNLENLIMKRDTEQYDFRDKISNIQLQANSKILEDKLSRLKLQLDETKVENTNMATNMVEIKNSLERERRENSELLKKVAGYEKNESKYTMEIQQLINEVTSLKASLETSSVNMRSITNEMGMMTRKMFEKDLQLSAMESKKEQITTTLEEISLKLRESKVSTVNVEEVRKMDVKRLNYNEIILILTSTKGLTTERTNTESGRTSRSEHDQQQEEEILRRLERLVNFNEMLVVLCVNLAKELNVLTGKVLNMTNFSNIFETFKVEVINPDVLKNEYMVKISDLENKIKNLEKLNKDLGKKHVWEKSVMRIKEKYEKSLTNHKIMLKECNRMFNLNEKALDSLRSENSRLLTDCAGAAQVMTEYETKYSETKQELSQLKDLIYTMLPNELKFEANKEKPVKSIEMINNYLNKLTMIVNMSSQEMKTNRLLKEELQTSRNEMLESGMYTSIGSKGSEENNLLNNNNNNYNSNFNNNVNNNSNLLVTPTSSSNNNVNNMNYNNNNNNNNVPFVNNNLTLGNNNVPNNNYYNNNLVSNKDYVNANKDNRDNNLSKIKEELESNEVSKEELFEKEQLLNYKEQQLNEVYENVNYYCKLIVSDLKSQIVQEQGMDTDYESNKSNQDELTEDTYSDYRDEEYIVDKFEEILNLLNKLYYQNSNTNTGTNRSNRQKNNNNNNSYDDQENRRLEGNVILDMGVIKSIIKFVNVLKRNYVKVNHQNMFMLDELEYQFESLPTVMEKENKFKIFCNNLVKLLNIGGDFIYEQINENKESISELIQNLEDKNETMKKMEHFNMVKEQEIKENQYEISELKNQLEELEQLYNREKNNNREIKLNVDRNEYEKRLLRDELRELTSKNEKLMLLVNEYQQIVQLMK